MVIDYPNILIDRFDLQDQIEEDEARNLLLNQNL